MGFWPSRNTETKAAELMPRPVDARAVSHVTGPITQGLTMPGSDMDMGRQVNIYEKVLWVFRCVDARATAIARIPIVARKYGDDDSTAREDPLTKLLNQFPNTYESAFQFRYRLSTQLMLSRKGAFIEVVRSEAGRIVELHLLPSDNVEPIPDARTYVSGYRVKTNDGWVDLPKDKIIWIKLKPHPTRVYEQMTPLVAAGLTVDTDYLARLFNRQYLANNGRPGVIVAVKTGTGISNEDMQVLKSRYSGGPQDAGMATVIEADELSIAQMTGSPDASHINTLSASKEEILLAFGTPESQLGNASGRTFDNADAETEIYYTQTVQPEGDGTLNPFDQFTEGGMSDDIYLTHDWSTVDVLQRVKRREQQQAMAEYDKGLITTDEYLLATGRKPWKVAGTQVLWVPTGKLAITKDDETQEEVQKLVQVGAGAPPAAPEDDPNAPMGPEDQNRLKVLSERLSALTELKALPSVQTKARKQPEQEEPPPGGAAAPVAAAALLVASDRVPPQRLQLETQMTAVVQSLLARYIRALTGRLTGVKIRKDTRYWSPAGNKPLDVTALINRVPATKSYLEDLEDAINPARTRVARRFLREHGGDMPSSSELNRRINRQLLDQMETSFGKVLDILETVIAEADIPGASIEDLTDVITQVADTKTDGWARQQGRHAAGVVNEGVQAVIAEDIPQMMKTWHSIDDDRVRPSHWAVDVDTVGTSQKFRVGTSLMSYPRDPAGPIEQVANCRCWLTFRPATEGDRPGTPPLED